VLFNCCYAASKAKLLINNNFYNKYPILKQNINQTATMHHTTQATYRKTGGAENKSTTDKENAIPTATSHEEIHLWLCKPESINEPLLLNRYKNWLSKDELIKMQRFKFAKHQHQYLITRALIRSLLSYYDSYSHVHADTHTQIAPQDWQFEKNQWGKPYIIQQQNPNNWAFNLSHTEGLICCAISQGNSLGVDVEDIQRTGETLKIADRYFSPQEYKTLIQLPSTERNDRFFDLWTLKESYIKACGKGLSIPLDEFSFSFTQDQEISKSKTSSPYFSQGIHLDTQTSRQDNPRRWRFWNWSYQERYRVSLGLKTDEENQASREVKILSTIPLMEKRLLTNELKVRHQ